MEHQFNTFIAQRYGITEAILLHNFFFWTEKNRANGKHLRDGRVWTYNSISALSELFPYLTERQINYALEKLVKAGVLHKGNYNEKKYDRTMWYAIDDTIRAYYIPELRVAQPEKNPSNNDVQSNSQNSEVHFTNLSNGTDKIVEPIPDGKPYTNNIVTGEEIKPPDAKKLKDEVDKLDKLIKEAEKKKKEPDALWQHYIVTWVNFYNAKFKVDPVLLPKDFVMMRKLIDFMKTRSEKKGVEWNKETSEIRMNLFLEAAYKKDQWLRDNFSLSNIYSQINSIIQIELHGRQQPTEKGKSLSGAGKAAGAVSFAQRIRGQFEQDGTGNSSS